MAGCRSAMLTTAKPAVRVAAAWKRPSRKRNPGGRDVTVESLSWAGVSKILQRVAGLYKTHIKNDEEDQINPVQEDQHAE